MRTMLRRTTILIGGSAAGIIIGLAMADAAHADDRPQPLRNLIADVTNAVDSVLPDPEEPADKQPEPDTPAQPPARPVEDLVEEVVDGAEDVVEGIVDTVSPPDVPVDASTPGDVPDGADEPAAPTSPITVKLRPADELAKPSDPTDVTSATPTPVHTRNRYETRQAADYDGDRAQDAPWETLIRSLTGQPAPAPPDYSEPAQPLPPAAPGHDAAPSLSAPHAPTIGTDLPAMLAARIPPPDTATVRIPGRDLAADGRTDRPDAPSG